MQRMTEHEDFPDRPDLGGPPPLPADVPPGQRRRRGRIAGIIGGALLASLIALGAIGNLMKSSPAPSSSQQAIPQLQVVFRDDFSDPTSGWQSSTQDTNVTAGYIEGTYRIAYAGPSSDGGLVAYRTAGISSNVVEADADFEEITSATPNQSSYGVFCATDAQGSDGYGFIVDPADGEWRVVTPIFE